MLRETAPAHFSSLKHNNRGPGRLPVYEILTKFCSRDYHFIFLDFIYYVGNGFTYKQQKKFFLNPAFLFDIYIYIWYNIDTKKPREVSKNCQLLTLKK